MVVLRIVVLDVVMSLGSESLNIELSLKSMIVCMNSMMLININSIGVSCISDIILVFVVIIVKKMKLRLMLIL